jgi:hypothetical protein
LIDPTSFDGVEMATTKTSISVTCPNCDKTLRLSARPAQGKKIKCPACEEIFVPKFKEASAITANPSQLKASASKNGKRPRAEEEDDVDDEEEEEEEERPAKKKNKKKKAKAGSNMVLILLLAGGGFLLLSVGGFVLTAFVWPGFMISKPNGPIASKDGKNKGNTGEGNAFTSFMHADAHIAVGGDLKSMRDGKQKENIAALIKQMEKTNGKMPAAMTELMPECERIMMTVSAKAAGQRPNTVPVEGGKKGRPGKGKGPPPKQVPVTTQVVVVQMTADGIAKAKKLPGVGEEEKLGKYKIHRTDDKFMPMVLAFPTDRILVFTSMADADITTMLDNAAQGRPDGKLAKMIAQVESKHVWGAWTPDDETKKWLREMDVKKMAAEPDMPPQTLQILQAAQKFVGGTFTLDGAASGSLDIRLQAEFEDAAAATSIKEGGDGVKQFALTELRKLNSKELAPVLKDLDGLTFQADGAKVSAKLTISAESIKAGQDTLNGKDGGGKKPPKGGPMFTVPKLNAGQIHDQLFQLQGDKKYRLTMTSNTQARTKIQIIVFHGAKGVEVVAASDTPGPNQMITFAVTLTDTYRINLQNNGPGNATSVAVNIVELESLQWVKFSPPGMGVEVSFPKAPQMLPDIGDVHAAGVGRIADFELGYQIEWQMTSKSMDESEFLKIKNGILRDSKGKLVDEKKITKDGFAGLDIVIDQSGTFSRSQAYISGKRLVILGLLGRDEKAVRSEAAEKFFASFKANGQHDGGQKDAGGSKKTDPQSSMSFDVPKLPPGESTERSYKLPAGKKYSVAVASSKRNPNYNLAIYRGKTVVGHILDVSPSGVFFLFTAETADTYRIQVINTGTEEESLRVTITER